jgi:hypothetical protein
MAATSPAVTLRCTSFRASQQTKPNVSSASPASRPTSDPERVSRGEPIRSETSSDGEAASADLAPSSPLESILRDQVIRPAREREPVGHCLQIAAVLGCSNVFIRRYRSRRWPGESAAAEFSSVHQAFLSSTYTSKLITHVGVVWENFYRIINSKSTRAGRRMSDSGAARCASPRWKCRSRDPIGPPGWSVPRRIVPQAASS